MKYLIVKIIVFVTIHWHIKIFSCIKVFQTSNCLNEYVTHRYDNSSFSMISVTIVTFGDNNSEEASHIDTYNFLCFFFISWIWKDYLYIYLSFVLFSLLCGIL